MLNLSSSLSDLSSDEEPSQLPKRVSKDTVSLLNEKIGATLKPKTGRNKSLDSIQQILIALRFYATGTFQQVVGDCFGGIHKATISRVVKRVTDKIASLKPEYIRMPTTMAERAETKARFYAIAHFPGVIGAVDCTHVRIHSPGGENAEMFRNRKGYFSINVQVVCDATLRVCNIVARWPGSVHDSTIFNDSALCAEFEAGRYGNDYILGDKGYACRNFLLTPLANPQTRGEVAYNFAQVRTRNTIERCFGVLKSRFPALAGGMRLQNMETTLAVIVACAVLHNICILASDEQPDFEYEDLQDEVDVPEIIGNEARNPNTAVRRAVINTVFD